jgi:hypothetical protein
MRHWETIADKLSKADWTWGASQRLIPTGEQSGLLTRIATTQGVSSFAVMKSWRHFLNLRRLRTN